MKISSGASAVEEATSVSAPSSNSEHTIREQFLVSEQPLVYPIITDPSVISSQMLMFTPNRLRECVIITNKLYTAAVGPANGKLKIMLGLFAMPREPYYPAYMVPYES